MPRSNKKATLRHAINTLIACQVDALRFMCVLMEASGAPQEAIARIKLWADQLPIFLVMDHEDYTPEELERARLLTEQIGQPLPQPANEVPLAS